MASKAKKGNIAKHDAYALAFRMMDDAIAHRYPLQAITIEESILADRLWSTLNVGKAINPSWQAQRQLGDALKAWHPEGSGFKESKWNENRKILSDDPVMEALFKPLDVWWLQRCRLLHGIAKSFQGEAPEIPAESFVEEAMLAAVSGREYVTQVANWTKKSIRQAKVMKKIGKADK